MSERTRPSGGFHVRASARCPFYKRDNAWRTVVCEGISKNSEIGLSFKTSSEMNAHVAVLCTGEYEGCKIYKMLLKKYDEEK